MRNLKKKRDIVSMYSAKDYFAGKKDAEPVGQMSNPDDVGPVFVDSETLLRLMSERRPASRGGGFWRRWLMGIIGRS